jgi:hypothetical protein
MYCDLPGQRRTYLGNGGSLVLQALIHTHTHTQPNRLSRCHTHTSMAYLRTSVYVRDGRRTVKGPRTHLQCRQRILSLRVLRRRTDEQKNWANQTPQLVSCCPRRRRCNDQRLKTARWLLNHDDDSVRGGVLLCLTGRTVEQAHYPSCRHLAVCRLGCSSS